MWSAIYMHYLKEFYSATSAYTSYDKMFLDDSLHNTYNYVDRPYVCILLLLATISYQFCLGGDATFCNKVAFCLP